MKIINYIKKNIYFILIPLLAVITFATWYFELSIVDNIYIFGIILLVLTALKQPPSTMMIVVLFSVMGTYTNEVYLLYQLLFIYVIIIALITFIKEDRPLRAMLLAPLTASLLLSAVTLLWTPSFIDGIAEFLVIVQGFMAYLIFTNDKHPNRLSLKQLPWLFTFMTFVLGLQYFVLTYEVFPNPIDKYSLRNFYVNANIVAAMLGLLWIPSLYKYKDLESNKWLLLAIPIDLLAIYSIYMSMSRGLYLAYFSAIFFAGLIYFKVDNKKVIKILTGLLLSFIVLMFVVIILEERLPILYEYFNETSHNRVGIYNIAIRTLKNPFKLIFGNGLGAARFNLSENFILNIYYHSWFFHILGTRGLINLIIQFYVMLQIFKISLNSSNQARLILIALFIYLTHSLVDIGYDYQHLGIMYYMLFALIENENTKMIEKNNTLVLEGADLEWKK